MDPQPKIDAGIPRGDPRRASKAERYRFLNESWQAESICRDVLAIDPDNPAALVLLVLSLTDQFEQGLSPKEALHIVGAPPNGVPSSLLFGHCSRAAGNGRISKAPRLPFSSETGCCRMPWSGIGKLRRFGSSTMMMRYFVGILVFVFCSVTGYPLKQVGPI
jgi:hypothetical protein